ncbi:MAG: hypothetical protein ACRCU0_02235 [Candidatus Rhabdochlamydia sp.]
MTNIHLNLSQHINYLLHPMGVTLSNKKQIFAKITTIALAAIFLVDKLHSATAKTLCDNGNDFCLLKCFQRCLPPVKEPDCSMVCDAKCCK